MEYHNSAAERLSVPTDFSAPIASRNIQKNLMPPSHFSSTAQPLGMHRAVQNQATIPVSWAATPTVPVPSNPTNPWLTVTGRGGVLELHKENQRHVMLQADAVKGKTSSDPSARFLDRSEPWSRLESECHLKVETHNAEAERLEGQVEALKNAAERNRKEMRDKEIALNRHSHSMEEMRSELSRALTELSHVKVALHQNIGEKHRIGSQLNRLERESGEEIARLKQDLELSSEAAHDLADKAEVERRQLEEEVKQQTVTLTLTRREHETELQQLTATHQAALAVAQHANSELHDRHHSMTCKLLRIERSLNEVSNERDLLRNRLSQMGQAFETQSATLQSLRNYIGQLSPKRGEEERLAETVESLNKEKEALQMTAELLTVRLTSVNEILNLQEKKMVAENLSDPLLQHGSKGLQVLRLWREKVYKLCVQLCSKDIELKAQKDELISAVLKQQSSTKSVWNCFSNQMSIRIFLCVDLFLLLLCVLGAVHGAASQTGAVPGQCAPT